MREIESARAFERLQSAKTREGEEVRIVLWKPRFQHGGYQTTGQRNSWGPSIAITGRLKVHASIVFEREKWGGLFRVLYSTS